ncbi:virulence RhuM family protein [Patulibacter minatonensis]|uniref:virulence RhuM family protein n=1 Tax=Patulibacter minatonensis TaxID=298163 RepID=UPI000683F818|nr:virulence RhuM family protein [Patulibacter minatonensis]
MRGPDDTGGGAADVVLYQADDGSTKLQVRMVDETVWLSQAQMVDLFQSSKSNVSEHIRNVFAEGELEEFAVVRDFRTTAADGKTYRVKHYDLDVIISVGYRVKSLRGTQFRRWALDVLREYLVKGFAMDDDRLKGVGGGDYWRELLERIRDIRSSEKVLYRQVLDLYGTSADYDPRAPESRTFFKVVQNKLHYAAHGHTAAEVIVERADASKPNMGLMSFAGEQPRRSDVRVAKNYLTQDELTTLNRMVSAFFELAELQATRRKPMYMQDWIREIDDFADRYGEGVLPNAGSVSQKAALARAEAEFDEYRKRTADEPTPVEREYATRLKHAEERVERSTREDRK